MGALFAGMKIETAFWTFAHLPGCRGQNSSTLSASGNRMGSSHLHGSGTESLLLRGTIRGRSLSFFTTITIAVTVLPIFLF
ncbi:MAG TPA: hypothetical protein VFA74_08535 [Terriglobales bacterium]|nr:hypothetical protein [Terriglobales bacterium]